MRRPIVIVKVFPPRPPRPPDPGNDYVYDAGVELERRLYESAIAAVEQTFKKEGLVAAFLTSGVIVAYAASLQAFAQLVPLVGRRATWTVTGILALSLCSLAYSAVRFTSVLKGHEVKDLSEAVDFIDNGDPPPTTKDEVRLKLMAEYRQARLNHEELAKKRIENLFQAMSSLGLSALLSFVGVLVAFVSVSIHKEAIKIKDTSPTAAVNQEGATSGNLPKGLAGNGTAKQAAALKTQDPAYNKVMADKPTSRPPTVLPKPGSGTTMVKGGGGLGTQK